MRVWFPILVCLVTIGCGRSAPSIPDVAMTDPPVRDSLGRSVPVPVTSSRIVSLAASNTEILFALGLGDAIVGNTEFCDYPDAAKTKPKIGGFAPQTFNVEAIAAMKPDLVLAAGEFQRPTIESLERLGITVAGFQGESIDEIAKNVEAIGKLVRQTNQAKGVVEKMRAALATIAKRVEGKPRPKVFYLVSDDPLMTAASKSMISEAIVLAGGENVFGDLDGDYVRISDEEILKRNPATVLVPQYGHSGRATSPKVLGTMEAVKRQQVFPIEADAISRPAPRIVSAIEQISFILHPKD
jgi:iron complex transport system substrate-binding protein